MEIKSERLSNSDDETVVSLEKHPSELIGVEGFGRRVLFEPESDLHG